MLNLNLSAVTKNHSLGFLQKMLSSMDKKHSEYGDVKKNYAGKYDIVFLDDFCDTLGTFLRRWDNRRCTTTGNGNALLFVLKRLYFYAKGSKDKHFLPGNTEILIDAANGCMIEYMSPQVPGAVAQSDKESIGFSGLYMREVNKESDNE